MSDLSSSIEHDPLLADLTEPQRQAVQHVNGPLLVLAGAGSGKTRVITRRIAHLIQRAGIAPWNVLAITFTNKATGEMRDRVTRLLTPKQAQAVNVNTFHSLCSRVIRRYADRLGFPPGYSIYDTADQQKAVKQAMELLDIGSSNFPPSRVLGTISNAKNELIDADAFAQSANGFYDKTVARIYVKYQQVLKQNKAMDFDDLILSTVRLMREHADVLDELRDRYRYILIDEYQDTNHAQFVLANALAAEHKNICATGDPDQSIYGWRGANIRNILEFETHYPNAQVVRLEQNYRSTKNILAAADGLIRNNAQRKHKSLWTENETGEPVRIARCHDERAEAKWIVEQFKIIRDRLNIPWSGFAVFYRTNSLSRVMEDALRDAGVPYQIARGTAFFDRKEIKDSVAYLRTIANPADEVNLLRVINLPARGISITSVKSMQAHAVARHMGMDDVVHHPADVPSLNTRAVASVSKFAQMIDGLRREAGLDGQEIHGSLKSYVERVLRETGLEDHYRNDKSDADGDRIENLGELVSSAQQFESDMLSEIDATTLETHEPTLAGKLLAYLEQIALISDADVIDSDQGAVTMMTLHAAKGLEFPVVAMIGVEDGLLPHERSQGSDSGMEEERRLCFVGITRAMRLIMLTHTRYRTVFGSTMPAIPSRFLQEIPRDKVEEIDIADDGSAGFHSPRERVSEAMQRQRDLAETDAMDFPPGTMVRHAQFGIGRILTVKPTGSHTRAQVEFIRAGVKTVILQYARLEKVDF